MELFNQLSFKMSKLVTQKYSTSFSLGISALDKKYRDPIYAIYGFVRLADEIVDSFHGYDKKRLLNNFIDETHAAIEMGISTNPIIHSFQETVRKYNIELEHIDAFFASMKMDLYNGYYEKEGYKEYIFGSAEAVGLMCLKVFVEGNQNHFDKLKKPAQALGSAFQKVNFLRDLKSDIDERERIYLPGISSLAGINEISKKQLEAEIQSEFDSAVKGIKMLPISVRLGVYSAYLYYLNLFESIRRYDINKLLSMRVRVSNWKKFALLTKSIIEVKVLKTC